MSKIVVHRHHGLRMAGAKRLAQSIAERLKTQYGGSYTWDGDTLRFLRTGASGQVLVTKDSFEVRVELGFLLTPLHSRIEREIDAFCDEHFGRTGAADVDQPAPARPAALRSEATRSSRSQGMSRSVRPK
jgi:putative polyhydroxyalkanoate system protein